MTPTEELRFVENLTIEEDYEFPSGPARRVEAAITFGRRRLTPLSEAVQRQLGLPHYQPGLTIRAFLDGVAA